MTVNTFTACHMPDAILNSSFDNPKADHYSLSISLSFYANKTLLLFATTMCQPQVVVAYVTQS